ncbi:cytochrome P450 [Mycobacteriaceae bacterium NPDC060252]
MTEAQPGVRTDSTATDLMLRLLDGSVQDPFPFYNEIRELGDGLHWFEPLQMVLATRYDDVRRIATDHKTFSSDTFWTSPAGMHDPGDAEHRRFVDINSREFMFADPPTHTQLRSTFRHAFTPAAIAAWRPLVEHTTDELLDQFTVGQDVDFVSALAVDVPVAIIGAILGVPVHDRHLLREWSFSFASTLDPLVQGERRDQCIRQSLELFDYLAATVAERRQHPADDLISQLVQTRTDDGELLDDPTLLAQLGLLLIAGNETTSNLLANSLQLLMEHPDVAERWRQDPTCRASTIEEVLRCDPPLHLTGRKTTRPLRLGDHNIESGAMVLTLIAAANRDPRHFDEPDLFDIDRPNNQHLAFFHGIHFCVGAPLARLEGEIFLTRFLSKFPGAIPGADPRVRRTTNIVSRGWEKLPVRL